MNTTMTLNDREVLDALERISSEIEGGLPGALRLAGMAMVRHTVENFQRGIDPDDRPWRPTSSATLALRPGGGGGGKTLIDTGLLVQSISTAIPRVDGSSVTIGTNRPGARAHQEGMTIRPVRARKLAQPLTREARRTGPRRLGTRYPTFIQRSKAGNLLIFKKERDGSITPVFLLRDSVDIPQRRFFGFGRRMREGILEVFGGYIRRALGHE